MTKSEDTNVIGVRPKISIRNTKVFFVLKSHQYHKNYQQKLLQVFDFSKFIKQYLEVISIVLAVTSFLEE